MSLAAIKSARPEGVTRERAGSIASLSEHGANQALDSSALGFLFPLKLPVPLKKLCIYAACIRTKPLRLRWLRIFFCLQLIAVSMSPRWLSMNEGSSYSFMVVRLLLPSGLIRFVSSALVTPIVLTVAFVVVIFVSWMVMEVVFVSSAKPRRRLRLQDVLLRVLTGPLMVPMMQVLLLPMVSAEDTFADIASTPTALAALLQPLCMLCLLVLVTLCIFGRVNQFAETTSVSSVFWADLPSLTVAVDPVVASLVIAVHHTRFFGLLTVFGPLVPATVVALLLLSAAVAHTVAPVQAGLLRWSFVVSVYCTSALVAPLSAFHPLSILIALPLGITLAMGLIAARLVWLHGRVSLLVAAHDVSRSVDGMQPHASRSILKDAPLTPLRASQSDPGLAVDAVDARVPGPVAVAQYAFIMAQLHGLYRSRIRVVGERNDILCHTSPAASRETAQQTRIAALYRALQLSAASASVARERLVIPMFALYIDASHDAALFELIRIPKMVECGALDDIGVVGLLQVVVLYNEANAVRKQREVGFTSDELAELHMAERRAKELGQAARTTINRLWKALDVKAPDLQHVVAIAADVHSQSSEADQLFRKVLLAFPGRVHLLRRYADFLTAVRREEYLAKQLSGLADDVAEEDCADSSDDDGNSSDHSASTVQLRTTCLADIINDKRRMEVSRAVGRLRLSATTLLVTLGLVFVGTCGLFQLFSFMGYQLSALNAASNKGLVHGVETAYLVSLYLHGLDDPAVIAQSPFTTTDDVLAAAQDALLNAQAEKEAAASHASVLSFLVPPLFSRLTLHTALAPTPHATSPPTTEHVPATPPELADAVTVGLTDLVAHPTRDRLDRMMSLLTLPYWMTERTVIEEVGSAAETIWLVAVGAFLGCWVLAAAVLVVLELFLLKRAFAAVQAYQEEHFNIFLHIPARTVRDMVQRTAQKKLRRNKTLSKAYLPDASRVIQFLEPQTTSSSSATSLPSTQDIGEQYTGDGGRFGQGAAGRYNLRSLESDASGSIPPDDSDGDLGGPAPQPLPRPRPDPSGIVALGTIEGPAARSLLHRISSPDPAPRPDPAPMDVDGEAGSARSSKRSDIGTRSGTEAVSDVDGRVTHDELVAELARRHGATRLRLRALWGVLVCMLLVGVGLLLLIVIVSVLSVVVYPSVLSDFTESRVILHLADTIVQSVDDRVWAAFTFPHSGSLVDEDTYYTHRDTTALQQDVLELVAKDVSQPVYEALAAGLKAVDIAHHFESVAMMVAHSGHGVQATRCQLAGFTYNFTGETWADADLTEYGAGRSPLFYTDTATDLAQPPDVQVGVALATLDDAKYWKQQETMRSAVGAAQDYLVNRVEGSVADWMDLQATLLEYQSNALSLLLALRVVATLILLVALILNIQLKSVDFRRLDVLREKYLATDIDFDNRDDMDGEAESVFTEVDSRSTIQSGPLGSQRSLSTSTALTASTHSARTAISSIPSSINSLMRSNMEVCDEGGGTAAVSVMRRVHNLSKNLFVNVLGMIATMFVISIGLNTLALATSEQIRKSMVEANAVSSAEHDFLIGLTALNTDFRGLLSGARRFVSTADLHLLTPVRRGLDASTEFTAPFGQVSTIAAGTAALDAALAPVSHMTRVAVQLTVWAADVPSTAAGDLDGFIYDALAEPGHAARAIRTPNAARYTNSTHDATLVPEEQTALARDLLFSPDFRDAVEAVRVATLDLADLVRRETAASLGTVQKNVVLLVTVFACFVVGILGTYGMFCRSVLKIATPPELQSINVIRQPIRLRRVARLRHVARAALGAILAAVTAIVAYCLLVGVPLTRFGYIDQEAARAADILMGAALTFDVASGQTDAYPRYGVIRGFVDHMWATTDSLTSDPAPARVLQSLFTSFASIGGDMHIDCPGCSDRTVTTFRQALREFTAGVAAIDPALGPCGALHGASAPGMAAVHESAWPLGRALLDVVAALDDRVQLFLVSAWVGNVPLLAGAIVLLVCIYVLAFRPMFRQLAEDEGMVRSLLNMVPKDDVADGTLLGDFFAQRGIL